ncbi:exonuclease domain-containing protein [Nonomuraea sp. NPDC046802]|uniref:exonuclease domain-containing protein n=1 Tax=Nonomuraea sp. NPDC046802 TaxID=3154919 RepID=UPI0033D6A345
MEGVPMPPNGYAVIDTETTGLRPTWHDRIIELGIVHLDASGEITREWGSLVNPGRDLGPQRIHRITACMRSLTNACHSKPIFLVDKDIAPSGGSADHADLHGIFPRRVTGPGVRSEACNSLRLRVATTPIGPRSFRIARPRVRGAGTVYAQVEPVGR